MDVHSNNRAGHVGREGTVEAFGKTYAYGRWTRGVWAEIAKWARGILPNPIEECAKGIEAVAAADMEILRRAMIADQAEAAKAKAENRQPVLMAERYKPLADKLIEEAAERAACYLSFNSPELTSLRNDIVGMSYIFFLLLRQKNEDMTEDLAYEILMAIGQKEIQRVFSEAAGVSAGREKND